MTGKPIEIVKNSVQSFVTGLHSDPCMLEVAYLSVITFNNLAKQIVPLIELSMFEMPDIQASGDSALGAALLLLAEKIDTEVVKSTAEVKGDWKPLVCGSVPTDDWKAGLVEFKKQTIGSIAACVVGQGADIYILKQITADTTNNVALQSSCVKIVREIIRLDTADSAWTLLQHFQHLLYLFIEEPVLIVDPVGPITNDNELSELPPPLPEVNIIF
jgi:uncharacterized protein YegL